MLGLLCYHFVMSKKDQILQLRSEGKTYNEIRKLTGASKGTISHYCGDGQKEKTMDRIKSTRKTIDKYVREYKETHPCEDCGQYYAWWILQFDHLPEFEKLFNISQYKTFTLNLDVIKEEMDKCHLVCANCHAHRTHLRRNNIPLEDSENLV